VTKAKEFAAGWRDLLAATLGLACGVPAYTPVSSLFFRVLVKQFGWSATAAAASLIALPLTGLCLPVAGTIIDRYGVRRVAFVSIILLALSYCWLSLMDGSLIAFYFGIIGLNVLGCATSPIAYTRPVALQFVRARGIALAICLLGISIGGILLPPILAHVLAVADWRAAYRLLGIISLVGGLSAIALLRPEPLRTRPSRSRRKLASAVIRDRSFWLLSTAIFLISVASIGLVSQFQSVMIEAGVAPAQSIALLSCLATSVFVSRLVIGWSLDTFSAEWTAGISLALAAIGAVGLLYSHGNFLYALPATLLIGFSIGAELDLHSFFCARYFGLQDFGAVYGAISVFFYTGMAVGAVLYGAIRDRTGSYSPAIAASAILLVIAAVLFIALPRSSATATQSISATRL
jgi:predicted MFS family arabinose efflux permease